MAGYKRKQTIYRLKFEEPDLEGLEVDTTGANLEEFVAIDRLINRATGEGAALEDDLSGMAAAMAEIKGLFAEHLVAWNLEEEDDTPVPATLESVRAQDDEFILDLVLAWADAVGGVSDPKELTSNGGSPFPVASIPMEPLSPSPLTLSELSSSSGTASDSAASQAS